MIKKIKKNAEYIHFDKLSNEWWDPNGKFKILHELAPLRINYIKNSISSYLNKKGNYITPLKNLKILDLGCGGGLICEPLSRLGAKVTGIDFVKKNIQIAKHHAKLSKLNIKYINQELSSIKLELKFDIILMLEVLEHIKDWENIIYNMTKYLKPNGIIIISTINRTLFSKIFAIYLAENILGWIPRNTHKYEQLIKPIEIIRFLENNNMRVLDKTGLVFNPFLREWFLNSKMTKMNYFCTAKKI